MTEIKPGGLPLAIGSFPYLDPGEALEVILKNFPQVPVWPQLPQAGWMEQMYNQCYDGLAGISFDPEREKLIAAPPDDAFFQAMAEVFEKVMAEDYEAFAFSPEKAKGFYRFLEESGRVKALNPLWVKGQVTGPVSFSLMVTDAEMKPILYDESYREMVSGVFRMKALWQLKRLQEIHHRVILFIDEPYLASVGSSMVAFSMEEAARMLSELAGAIREKGGIPGIHCCGNTDWAAVLASGFEVVSLDAYEYGQNFLLYPEAIKEFLQGGGIIAWGIVPTSEDVAGEDAQSLAARLEALMDRLHPLGLTSESILEQSFITPSCGLGSVPPERADRIMELTRQVSALMRERHGF